MLSLDIDEIKGWYVDKRPQGYQIDAIGSTSVILPAEQNATLLLLLLLLYASFICSLSHNNFFLNKFTFVILQVIVLITQGDFVS